MTKGIDHLKSSIMRTHEARGKDNVTDLGTITENNGLQLDQFAPIIPQSDYLVASWLVHLNIPIESRVARMASPVQPNGSDLPGTGYSQLTRTDYVGGDDGGHIKNIEVDFPSALCPGDRVLVIWVRDDPIVVSKVVPANA